MGYTNMLTGEFVSELSLMQDPHRASAIKSSLAQSQQFNSQQNYAQHRQMGQLQSMLGMGGLRPIEQQEINAAAKAIKDLPGYERHKDAVMDAVRACRSEDPSTMFKAAKQAILVADQRYIVTTDPQLFGKPPATVSEFDWLRRRIKEVLWHPPAVFA